MKSIRAWEIAGLVFIVVVGGAWHFGWAWVGRPLALAWLFPVNESVWEHLKLVFFPMLLWFAVERPRLREEASNLLTARALELLAAFAVIVGGFYLYTAIAGRNFLTADIALFVAAVVLGQGLSAEVMAGRRVQPYVEAASAAVLVAAFALFVAFSYAPPRTGLFRDPPTGTWGAAAQLRPH